MGLLAGSSEDSWKPSITSNTTARSYWFNWRVLLCGMWIVISISLASLLIRKYEPFCSKKRCGEETEHRKAEILYDDETWSTSLKGVHPAWLLGFRALAFCLLLAMLIAAVLVDGPSIYYYYTQWTSTSITIYFGLGLLLSVRGCIKYHNAAGGERVDNVDIESERGISAASTPAGASINSSSSKVPGPRIDHHARQTSGFWGHTFQILFQINAGAVVLTDCVFWFIIVPILMVKHYRLSFLDINMHTINVVSLLIDAALNCLRFPLFRMAYFFSWTVFFVIFQWILHACVPIWWPYPFLDLSSRYAPIWYLSVALMHLPCYGVFALVVKLKHFLLARWFPQSVRWER